MKRRCSWAPNGKRSILAILRKNRGLWTVYCMSNKSVTSWMSQIADHGQHRIQISQIACEMGYLMIQEHQQRHSKLYINNHSIVTRKDYKSFHFFATSPVFGTGRFKGLSHAGCRRFRELKLAPSSQLMVQFFFYKRLQLFLAVCCRWRECISIESRNG